MNEPSPSVNAPQNSYPDIASWLTAMRRESAAQPRAERPPQFILLVDNTPERQFQVSIFLQRLNYHVITARTAEDALAFLAMAVPLAVVTDIDLPQMSGPDLVKSVKQAPRTRDVPVLVCAANADPRVERSCREAGATACLAAAPLEELFAAIQKATEATPRRFVRLRTHLDVVVGDGPLPGGEVAYDAITAISERGMFVKTAARLAHGSVHPFTFFLPNAAGWIFRIEGRVIYNHHDEDSKRLLGTGVKFLKVKTEEQEFIRDFIRKTLMKGVAGKQHLK